jgi:hypothetical protein
VSDRPIVAKCACWCPAVQPLSAPHPAVVSGVRADGSLHGEPPQSVRGRRVGRQTHALLSDYRQRYGVTDPERALDP